MMSKISLTIGMPSYNVEMTIADTLDSITSQINDNLKSIYDLEVLICDNCSDDNTDTIINGYIKKYPDLNIRYYKNKYNIGAPGNIGAVLNQAKGEYVWLLGDDQHVKGSLISVYEALKQKPDVLMVQAKYFKDGIMSRNTESQARKDLTIFNGNPKQFFQQVDDDIFYFISSLIFKKEFVQKVNKEEYYKNFYPHILLLYNNIQNVKIAVLNKSLIIASQPTWDSGTPELKAKIQLSYLETVSLVLKWLPKDHYLILRALKSSIRCMPNIIKIGFYKKWVSIFTPIRKKISRIYLFVLYLWILFLRLFLS